MPDDILFSFAKPIDAQALKPSDKGNGSSKDSKKLLQACKDFESLLINQMMQQMRKTVPQDGLFNGGRAEKLYTEMLDSEMAKSISNQRGMGLAAMMYRQLAAQTTEKNEGDLE